MTDLREQIDFLAFTRSKTDTDDGAGSGRPASHASPRETPQPMTATNGGGKAANAAANSTAHT